MSPDLCFLNGFMPLKRKTIYKFAECELDVDRRVLTYRDEPVSLSPKTFNLFLYLLQNVDRVVTKDELLGALWPDSFVEERNLSQHVFLLRKAFGDSDLAEKLIVTVPSKGYRIGLPVEVLSPEPVTAPSQNVSGFIEHSVETSTIVVVEEAEQSGFQIQRLIPQSPQGKRRMFIAAAAGLLLAIAAGSWAWLHRSRPILRNVVLAQFENKTGESVLDDSLQSALRIELEQTPYLHLLGAGQVSETLANMKLPRNTPVSGETAREICQRANQQVVVQGAIARVGTNYLVTLQASNCQTGELVVGEKQSIPDENNVLVSLDQMTGRLRRELGESRRQIATFDVPLEKATTPSLEALRDYSKALQLMDKDDREGARVLLEHAVALDANFTEAWRRLGTNYQYQFNYDKAHEAFQRAFDLRLNATEAERLDIELAYYYGLNDLDHAIDTGRAAVAVYPDVERLWANLCESYRMEGRYGEAVDACRYALSIDPHKSLLRMASSLLGAGRLEEAKKTAQEALANGDKRYSLHTLLYRIAFLENDEAGMQQQADPSLAKGHEMLYYSNLGAVEACRGRVKSAMADYQAAYEVELAEGNHAEADAVRISEASVLIELGSLAEANRILATIPNVEANDAYVQLMQAEGKIEPVRRFLASAAAKPNGDTLHDKQLLPTLQASLAHSEQHPDEALKLLEIARPYQFMFYRVPQLRARIETSMGAYDAAIADEQLILANPGVDALDPMRIVAHLDLARLLNHQHQTDRARQEYKSFLDWMKRADPNLEIVKEARAELSHLQ
jgi:DNA-binding winged helix-turn-helix (wHTH) protein/tetratricopeptide (TPR) repeat protein